MSSDRFSNLRFLFRTDAFFAKPLSSEEIMDNQKSTKFKKTKLLPGAIVFLGLVLYFNIRFENEMDIIDWAVVLIGVTYLIIAMFKDRRRN
jgi:hypothetical protein